MNTEKYLAIVESYIEKNFRSVCDDLETVDKISGLVLTHVAPVASLNRDKILVRKSSFHEFCDLDSIFIKDGNVATDIYICPLAVSNSGLAMQVHIGEWGQLSMLEDGVPFVRSHGLSVSNDASGGIELVDHLPIYEVVPDEQKWIVDPLDVDGATRELRQSRATNSLRQILEGFEVTEDFKIALKRALDKEGEPSVLIPLLEMLGKVKMESGVCGIDKYLRDKNKEVRLTAFVAAVRGKYSSLKTPLLQCVAKESDTDTRTIMLKNIIDSKFASKEEIREFLIGLDLSKREKRLLEKNGILI